MRELRQGPAVVVDQVAHGEAVFGGAHRKPEVVLMSLDMEGMPSIEVEVDAARELAAGRIDFAEYRRIVSV